MGILDTCWQALNQDIGLFPGFRSPLLSWLGAAGILVFSVWHSGALLHGFLWASRAFGRCNTALEKLARARHAVNREWIALPRLKRPSSPSLVVEGSRRDLDDLENLDRILRAEPAFIAGWLSYRKTFAVEQPSWFIEPNVHADRSSSEFFLLEWMCADRLDLRFYHALPGLITGIGLTFTFLAILLGLSKLHADGSHIEGIQGLINGLAGKFLTSIVALVCANGFVLLDKSLAFRLERSHRRFIALLDEIFPQRVRERNAQSAASRAAAAPASSVIRSEELSRGMDSVNRRLTATVNALSQFSESLAQLRKGEGRWNEEELSVCLGQALKREFLPLFSPLRDSIDALSRAIEGRHDPAPLAHDDMERLVGAVKHRSMEERQDRRDTGRTVGPLGLIWFRPDGRSR
ncbi:MAG TPA: hypothetical protein VFS39_04830 [Nitrospira sp.]|nr:hypothetical protein [Nitrospira sp.]